MGREVFLTTLGTSAYGEGLYTGLTGEEPTAATPYVQEARLRGLESRGVVPDAVLALLTGGPKGARVNNWEKRSVRVETDCRPRFEKVSDGLQSRLEGLSVTEINIPDGGSEAELWEIFQAIGDHVEDGDTLYVDVTHGFRSLSIVLLTALDYLRLAKGVTIAQVSYGAWEAGQLEDGLRVSPTFDLTPFFVLREWTAALVLLEAGDLRALGRALARPRRELGRLLRKDTPRALGRLPGKLESLGEALWDNRLRSLPELVEATARNLEEVRSDLLALEGHGDEEMRAIVGALAPLQTVFDRLVETVGRLRPAAGEPPELWGMNAARFCVDHGLVVQALTFTRETLLDLALRLAGYAPDERRSQRESFLSAFYYDEPKPGGRLTEEEVAAFMRLHGPERSLLDEASYHELKLLADQTAKLRNALNHAGTGNNELGKDPRASAEGIITSAVEVVRAVGPLSGS